MNDVQLKIQKLKKLELERYRAVGALSDMVREIEQISKEEKDIECLRYAIAANLACYEQRNRVYFNNLESQEQEILNELRNIKTES